MAPYVVPLRCLQLYSALVNSVLPNCPLPDAVAKALQIVLLVAGAILLCGAADNPLTFAQLTQLLETGTPEATILQTINSRGLAFSVEERIVDSLRSFGASATVIAAVIGQRGMRFSAALPLEAPPSGHGNIITSVSISPDAKYLASGSYDKTVVLWEWKTGREVYRSAELQERVSAVAFSPDGATLATAGGRNVILLDARSGNRRQKLVFREGPRALSYSPDGRYLAIGGGDDNRAGTTKIAVVATRLNTMEYVLTANKGAAESLAFSPDGRVLASANGNSVTIWDLAAKSPVLNLVGPDDFVRGVAISPDGTMVAGAFQNGRIQVWDLGGGTPVRTLLLGEGGVRTVAFSPDGRFVVAGDDSGDIALLDIETGASRAILRGHVHPVNQIIYSRDGGLLISGGNDATVRVWDARQLKQVQKLGTERARRVAGGGTAVEPVRTYFDIVTMLKTVRLHSNDIDRIYYRDLGRDVVILYTTTSDNTAVASRYQLQGTSPIWRREFGRGKFAQGTIEDNALYVGVGDSETYMVAKIDLASGDVVWSDRVRDTGVTSFSASISLEDLPLDEPSVKGETVEFEDPFGAILAYDKHTGEPATDSRSYKAGEIFKECNECPEMVVVPAGRFSMGSPEAEWERDENEGPTHEVRIARPFAVGKYEVTRGQFAQFVREAKRGISAGCWFWDEKKGRARFDLAKSWRNPGFAQSAAHPVVCVIHKDAKAYVDWLAAKTGKPYRLLSESEWEYAARAGSVTSRFWGEEAENGKSVACTYANVPDHTSKRSHPGFSWPPFDCEDNYAETAPVGRFKPNDFGLYDMLGNVWEWVEDCYQDRYFRAPADGSAWLSGTCEFRVIRGGGWKYWPQFVRSAFRMRHLPDFPENDVGFRVARTLP